MKREYHKKLARPVTKGRCQVLTDGGDLCDLPAAWEFAAHLEQEIYQKKSWCALLVCEKHMESTDRVGPVAYRAIKQSATEFNKSTPARKKGKATK